MHKYILVFQCKDQQGIVAAVAGYIASVDGNIISVDEHTTCESGGMFFMRLEFCVGGGDSADGELGSGRGILKQVQDDMVNIGERFGARWRLFDREKRLRVGILLSRPDHCLEELLYRWSAGELGVDVEFVASNHDVHQRVVDRYEVPFYLVKDEGEILKLAEKTDFQILQQGMI